MLPYPGLELGGPGASGPALAGAGLGVRRGIAGGFLEDGVGVGREAGSGGEGAMGCC